MLKQSRLTLIVLISVIFVTAFCGCTLKPSEEAAVDHALTNNAGKAGKPQTIRVATTFTGQDAYTPVWQQVLEDFQAEYPDIKIINEATGAGGDTFKIKVITDFASGNEPDVTYGFNGALGKPIVDSGKVISWDDELKADTAWAESFRQDMLESCKYNGKLYALPFLGYYEGMWINKDVFEKCGLKLPKTYDDILKAVPVLRDAGVAPVACSFSDEPHYIIEAFILSTAGRDGHKNLYDPKWANALNLIKELYDRHAFTDDALTLKQGACVELFADKKAAMLFSGSWSQGKFKDFENTVVIPLPLVPGGKANPADIIGGAGTGWYLVGDLNSRKDGAGMKFIKYMTKPEVVARFAATAGVPLINCGIKAKTPTEQSGIDMMNNAHSINGAVGDTLRQDVFGAIWHGLSDIVTGKKTSEEVLNEARRLSTD